MKTGRLSRSTPTRDLDAKTVMVETGLPKDRLKGYMDDNTVLTGADARVALVGQYKKKNKKQFTTKNSPKRTYGGSGGY